MEISLARREIFYHKSLRLPASSTSSAPVLFLFHLSHREYCADGDRMANLAVLLRLLLFYESEY